MQEGLASRAGRRVESAVDLGLLQVGGKLRSSPLVLISSRDRRPGLTCPSSRHSAAHGVELSPLACARLLWLSVNAWTYFFGGVRAARSFVGRCVFASILIERVEAVDSAARASLRPLAVRRAARWPLASSCAGGGAWPRAVEFDALGGRSAGVDLYGK